MSRDWKNDIKNITNKRIGKYKQLWGKVLCPLIKRMISIFPRIIILYIILYYIYISYILPSLPSLFDLFGINIGSQKQIFTFLSKFGNSFLLPSLISIILFYFGIIENERLQYSSVLNELISEMNYNYSKILEFPKNVKEKSNKLKNQGELVWLPKKESYTNWADGNNFYFKYLPTNAYFKFINNGHILDKKYLTIPTGNIAKFYDLCITFNNKIQSIENSDPYSIDSLCAFIKDEHYHVYLYGNDLNKGLIGEYKIIVKNLEKYIDKNKEDIDIPVIEPSALVEK